MKSSCARRILRLCAEGCFESEKYEHVANARECDDEYPLRAMGDAVTKCKIAHGKDEFVCVRWTCRSKFEVDDVATQNARILARKVRYIRVFLLWDTVFR